jgi:hypothetical protein
MKSRLRWLIGLAVLAVALTAGQVTAPAASAVTEVPIPAGNVPLGSCNNTGSGPNFSHCSWDGTGGAAPIIGKNSCTVADSCKLLRGDLTIGDNSCTDGYACQGSNGDVGDGSCTGDSSCFSAAGVGDGSCIGNNACDEAEGNIGNGSCIGDFACEDALAVIGNGSCVGASSCESTDGSIGNGSCREFEACYYAQADIGNGACNGEDACNEASGTVDDCVSNDLGYECGQLTLRKFLFPSYDSGRFDLLIDGDVEAPAVGHNGTTGAIEVGYGGRVVSEAAVAPASLGNYRTTIVCQDTSSRAIVGYGYTPSLTVQVAPESDVVCTLINQRLRTWFWWR